MGRANSTSSDSAAFGKGGNRASRFDRQWQTRPSSTFVLRWNSVHQLLRRWCGNGFLPEIGTLAHAGRDNILAGVLKHARVVFRMIRERSLFLRQRSCGDAGGFTFSPARTPITPAIAPSGEKRKPNGKPVAQAGDAEGGGHDTVRRRPGPSTGRRRRDNSDNASAIRKRRRR